MTDARYRVHVKMKVGETLSQRGLAFRANYDVATIRRRGARFTVFVNGDRVAWRESWVRGEMALSKMGLG